jgi:hypothetical protein
MRFVEHLRKLNYEARLVDEKTSDGYDDVTVTKFMVPAHAAITAFELELERAAKPLGGRNDGWGSFSQGPSWR